MLTLVFWLLTTRSVYGFSVRTVGAAPNAARYGGFDASRTVWSTLMISGGMAGSPASSRRRASSARSISAFPPATASPRSSSRSSAGCIRSASSSPASILAVTYVGGQVAQTVVHVPERDRRHLPGDDAVLHPGERHPGPLPPAGRSRRRRARAGRGRERRHEPRDFIIDAIVTVVGVTTPILLAATGELVVEKSGVLNLGVEGMMLIGAITGFAVTFAIGPDPRRLAPWVGVVAAGARRRGVLDAVRACSC